MGSKCTRLIACGIPIVDLSKCGLHTANDKYISDQDYRDTGEQLLSAFSTWGVVRLSNHGIPWSDVDRLNKIADDLSKLPKEEQMRFDTGKTRFGVEIYGETKTYLNLDNVDRAYRNNDTERPEIQMRFDEVYFDLEQKAGRLLSRLLKALAFGLELKDKDFFVKAHSLINQKGNSTSLGVSIYLPDPTDDDQSEERKVRLTDHQDVATLVMIFQDDVGGLQVRDEFDTLIDVEPIPDTIIVNVGFVLQTWTGNKVKAVYHRVCTPEDPKKRKEIRRSIVYFGNANSDELMEKLEYENGKSDSDENTDVPQTVEQFTRSRTNFY